MKDIENIRRAIAAAARERKKYAAFNSQVLLNAAWLKDMQPAEFCRRVGVAPAYAIEFKKMIATANELSNMGYSIQKN